MRARLVICPAITFILYLGLWEYSIRWFAIPSYILPTPKAVLASLHAGFIQGVFWPHFFFTLKSAVLGYALGCGTALVVGTLMAESQLFQDFLYPYVVALQAMPKVALAPLILVWFGFGLGAKVLLVALICFFPLFVNTVVGIRQTDPELITLCEAFSASRLHVFIHVKLPSAAGSIFAGLQIAVALALIGAVVAEFVAAERGLGYLIEGASVTLNVSTMFAGVFTLAVMGIVGTELVRIVHGKVVFWEQPPSRKAE